MARISESEIGPRKKESSWGTIPPAIRTSQQLRQRQVARAQLAKQFKRLRFEPGCFNGVVIPLGRIPSRRNRG